MTSRFSRQVIAAVLTLVALPAMVAPAGAQYFGKNKVQYREFTWRIYRSPHFDVYYYEGEEQQLQKVVSFAESAYDTLSREFNYRIQESTPLIYYQTHSAFEQNNIIVNFIPEGVGAFASPVRNRMVMPIDMPDPELMELMLHELTHIFQYHMLFQGRLGKGVAATPPTWFMEGMASYMAKDESARDRMYLRDAVVNDRIPPVTQANVQGFFAYRFGHSVFDFVEERWGKDGFRDFIVETRNTIGSRVGRAVERTFQMTPEDFDTEFRRWLRKQYLPELVATGEPVDFGRPFRSKSGSGIQATSPVASPSGDLVAAFSTHESDVDVVIFDAQNRELLRNLTSGFSNDFQYLVAQELTLGRKMGRDLTFSPDGNTVALFARQGKGRKLVLVDVLKKRIRRVIDMAVEQQYSPAWSPDGRSIAFSGHREGRFDIFLLDLETEEISNLTSDEVYDGSPTFSPDGRSLVFSSVVGGNAKLFRIDPENPGERFQITFGESEDVDAVYSSDGSHLYFTSDQTGTNNIYGLDLETRELARHTNAVTGCFNPTVLPGPEGDRIVFTAFWKGRFDLYLLDPSEPITDPEVIVEASPVDEEEPMFADAIPRFEPAIEVAVDLDDTEKHTPRKFFLENATGSLGVTDDQLFIGQFLISFSDQLGDRRLYGLFRTVDSFNNFDVVYLNQAKRLQWQIHLFDDRDFYVTQNLAGDIDIRNTYSQTGVIASLIYPMNLYHRAELGAGFIYRELDLLSNQFDPVIGFFPTIETRTDEIPVVQGALVGDSAIYAPWGGITGRRWRVGGSWAPDLDGSGTLASDISVDLRQYLQVTRRSNFALRFVGSMRDGNFPTPFYFGGLDTMRGFDYRSIVGDRGFFSNIEYRFPLIDRIDTPFLDFQGIRGNVFVDIGGAWFEDGRDFDFWNSEENRLEDAISSYGWGVTMRFFGLDLNFDFSKRWDFKTSSSGFESAFWFGNRF